MSVLCPNRLDSLQRRHVRSALGFGDIVSGLLPSFVDRHLCCLFINDGFGHSSHMDCGDWDQGIDGQTATIVTNDPRLPTGTLLKLEMCGLYGQRCTNTVL